MSKRAAAVQLTQDNVDELDECTDEPGQFEVASDEQLKQRVIKKARRNKPFGDNASTGPSIFAGLKASQPFILERKPLSTAPGLSIGSAPPTTSQFGVTPAIQLGAPSAAATSQFGMPSVTPVVKMSPYLTQLKALNESVSDWIKKHVNSNPYVDLTPIFKDYQAHLTTIETKYKGQSEEEESQGSESRASETEETAEETTDEPTSAAESQESTQETQGEAPAQSTDDEDCLMSVRAKLFYKKGTEYCELGIGALKVQNSGDKAVRLLLRNDTSVGKILLNVRVTSDIPLSNKANNVFVVCAANPPLTKQPDDSPVSYLIRVKTAQMAENLLTTIKDNVN